MVIVAIQVVVVIMVIEVIIVILVIVVILVLVVHVVIVVIAVIVVIEVILVILVINVVMVIVVLVVVVLRRSRHLVPHFARSRCVFHHRCRQSRVVNGLALVDHPKADDSIAAEPSVGGTDRKKRRYVLRLAEKPPKTFWISRHNSISFVISPCLCSTLRNDLMRRRANTVRCYRCY